MLGFALAFASEKVDSRWRFASEKVVTNFFGGLVLILTQPPPSLPPPLRSEWRAAQGQCGRRSGSCHTTIEGDDLLPIIIPNSIFTSAVSAPLLVWWGMGGALEREQMNRDMGPVSTRGRPAPIIIPNSVFTSAVITNLTRAGCKTLEAAFVLRHEDVITNLTRAGCKTLEAAFVLRHEDVPRGEGHHARADVLPAAGTLALPFLPHVTPTTPLLVPHLLPHCPPSYLTPTPSPPPQVITNLTRAGCKTLEAAFVLRHEDVPRVKAITHALTAYLQQHPRHCHHPQQHPRVDRSKGPAMGYLKQLTGSGLQIGVVASISRPGGRVGEMGTHCHHRLQQDPRVSKDPAMGYLKQLTGSGLQIDVVASIKDMIGFVVGGGERMGVQGGVDGDAWGGDGGAHGGKDGGAHGGKDGGAHRGKDGGGGLHWVAMGYLKQRTGPGLQIGSKAKFLPVQQEILEKSVEIILEEAIMSHSLRSSPPSTLVPPTLPTHFTPPVPPPSEQGQSKGKFLPVQQEILEKSVEIILEEGALLGESAPYVPSASNGSTASTYAA
ncbi:unnamed protein product [Closterium sp. NIES-64]|nr:unnamed protein product [Closterium sp. NIES-64]